PAGRRRICPQPLPIPHSQTDVTNVRSIRNMVALGVQCTFWNPSDSVLHDLAQRWDRRSCKRPLVLLDNHNPLLRLPRDKVQFALNERWKPMNINTNNYSVLEILNMLDRRELLVNQDYQRGSGLWPDGASSYFIDTILEGFPFPKIYMYEFLDRAA